jgi:hypothetical protein
VDDEQTPIPVDPPEDPESWTDEQWLAWLEATDDPAAAAGTGGPRPWRQRRPASMLGAAMLGMHELIYGRRDQAAIVIEAGGDPPGDDLQPEVHLDPDHPERSEVIVHARHRRDPSPAAGAATSDPEADAATSDAATSDADAATSDAD